MILLQLRFHNNSCYLARENFFQILIEDFSTHFCSFLLLSPFISAFHFVLTLTVLTHQHSSLSGFGALTHLRFAVF